VGGISLAPWCQLGRRLAPTALALIFSGLLAAGCGSGSSSSSQAAASSTTASTSSSAPSTQATGQLGYEGVPLEPGPLLAQASSTAPGIVVDGIQCSSREQLAYHIHARLQVYVSGQPRSLPGGIGLLKPVVQTSAYGPVYGAQQCYYWLHTHASDGVVHIESPTRRIYTLGEFFDEWGQPLDRSEVAGARGPVTVFFNGQRVNVNPRAVPLLPRAVIQLDVGSPIVPFGPISWSGTGL
jgi:hypothetical protein